MYMNWLLDNLIYLTISGSQSYGMATEYSDLDVKGICIPPNEVQNDLFHTFEQAENNKEIETKYSHLKNPKNPKFESTIYSLKKFIKLAANVNPNIIEVLFTDDSDVLEKQSIYQVLKDNRNLFLSSKAKFTFSGYSFSQLARIERHRKWLKLKEIRKPIREDYGLKSESLKQFEDVFRYIKRQTEQWTLSQYPLDEQQRFNLQEDIWELTYHLCNKQITWDNWPEKYQLAAISKIQESLGLKEEIIDLIKRESQYKIDKQQYESWLNWKKNRNPERAKLEEKCGYDSKHASQLVRLLLVGYEILTEGVVRVKRPDAKELLSIKNGAWTYERLMEYSESMNKKLDEAYKTTKLPKSVNYKLINVLYHKVTQEYCL